MTMLRPVTVIYHRADYDGLFCCEIAKKFLMPFPSPIGQPKRQVRLIGWDYGDAIPVVDEDHILLMMDICVPDLMGHRNLIWIDHHKTSMDRFPNMPQPSYTIDGVAACRLAYQWFKAAEAHAMADGLDFMDVFSKPLAESFLLPVKADYIDRNVHEPLAIRMAGEYDIWDKRDPNAETFQYGLRAQEELDMQELLLFTQAAHEYTMEIIDDGYVAQRYARTLNEMTMKRAFIANLGYWNESKLGRTVKFLCLNTALCNSLTFASIDYEHTGHDALCGFYFNGKEWVYSLYHAKHNTDIDLSAIAKDFGGGGHKGACGFRSLLMAFDLSNCRVNVGLPASA